MSVTGGGPERDNIHGGKGNDFVLVENDTVSDSGGENTFLVTGSGDDTIEAGPGTGVIGVNKTSGSIHAKPGRGFSGSVVWESRRIDYQGDALTTRGTINSDKVVLYEGHGHHDTLRMTAYNPLRLSSSSPEQMIVLLHDLSGFPSKYSKPKLYFDDIDDIADLLFENTRCTRSTDPPVFCPEASESQQIFYGSIERFELSKSTVNLLLLAADASSQCNATHEIIGGPFDDYIVNAFFRIPLMAQLGAGANRIYSRNASDSSSLILDEHKDIIYDTGGHNLVAVMLPEGVSFSDVYIGNKNPDGDSFFVYHGVKKESIFQG